MSGNAERICNELEEAHGVLIELMTLFLRQPSDCMDAVAQVPATLVNEVLFEAIGVACSYLQFISVHTRVAPEMFLQEFAVEGRLALWKVKQEETENE